MHEDATFGHVKFMKTLYLVEHLAELDLGGNYHRAAAGPLDNRMIRSVDSQMKRQKWFDRVVRGTGPDGKALGYAYVPMENAGGHRPWFEKYWGGARARIQAVIDLLRPFRARRGSRRWGGCGQRGFAPKDEGRCGEGLHAFTAGSIFMTGAHHDTGRV
jgi:type I restriction enzyme S subunit